MADRNELNRDHAGVAAGSQRVQTYRASQYHIGHIARFDGWP